ncbi:hypothetical protein FRB91_002176 [Serendipita sp. 411]|nr:hypothetical protein FRC18_010824 [Serendipita sp. 400]KAG8844995.1 hypothetical protein FRB91_002176 [Serendipita sp. 411]
MLSGGTTQTIYNVVGDPGRLVKGEVFWQEASFTRMYEPRTVIGTTTPPPAGSAPGQRNVDGNFHAKVQTEAPKVHALPEGASGKAIEDAHKALKQKKIWWMVMPLVGEPIRKLPRIAAALAADKKPEPEKQRLIADCETYVQGQIMPMVHSALDEFYNTIHAKSNHWVRFGDIKVSHFRFIDGGAKARMIDFGTVRIARENAKPTDETINVANWLKFCQPGYEESSNTPSVGEKTPSHTSAEGVAGPSRKGAATDHASASNRDAGSTPAGALPAGAPTVASNAEAITQQQPPRTSSPRVGEHSGGHDNEANRQDAAGTPSPPPRPGVCDCLKNALKCNC